MTLLDLRQVVRSPRCAASSSARLLGLSLLLAATVGSSCGKKNEPAVGAGNSTSSAKAVPAPAVGAPSTPPNDSVVSGSDALYALGASLADAVPFHGTLSDEEKELLVAGAVDALAGKVDAPRFAAGADALPRIASELTHATAAAQQAAAAALSEKFAAQPGARKLASGAIMVTKSPGRGAAPTATDTVQLRVSGQLADGTKLESSGDAPIEMMMASVIPCWQQALLELRPGGAATVLCPAASAYGDQGMQPAIPPGATLVYELNLVGINKSNPPSTDNTNPGVLQPK